jgi:hypothetical protein
MASGRESGNEQAPTAGVDETLIDEMLALSPEERLRQNDRTLRTIELLRQGLAARPGTMAADLTTLLERLRAALTRPSPVSLARGQFPRALLSKFHQRSAGGPVDRQLAGHDVIPAKLANGQAATAKWNPLRTDELIDCGHADRLFKLASVLDREIRGESSDQRHFQVICGLGGDVH